MATYQQWSQSYFTNLTPDQHNANNRWFKSIRDKLTDSELKETINYYDEDEGLYEELVEIALLPDPKLLIKEDNPND